MSASADANRPAFQSDGRQSVLLSLLRPADVPRDVRRRDAVVELRGRKLLVGPLAVRGQTRTSTETGEAPGWQGATRGE